MQTFTLSGNEFFDQVSYPVLLAQDQIVTYFNQAAEELFRLQQLPLAEGQALPEPLRRQSGMGISARKVGEEELIITSRIVEAGTLYLLRQERDEEQLSRARFHQLAERMRGPMSSMTASIQILEKNLVETERLRNERYLALFQKSYYRLLRLSNNVETLCQLENAWIQDWYTPCIFDLAGLCRKIVREADHLTKGVGIALSYQEQQSSVLMDGDERLITIMLYHLIANAVQSLKGDSGEVRLKLACQGKQALVMVEDGGKGMNDRELIAAFDPDTDETEMKPLGMGLTICRKIATLHCGALMLTSGKLGTKVTFSVPVTDGREVPDLRSRAVDYTGGFPTVLVALSDLLPETFFRPEELE